MPDVRGVAVRLTGYMTTTDTTATYSPAAQSTNGHTPYSATAPYRTLSVTSFVFGLASIVFGWTFIAPIAGLVIGILALSREPRGKAFAVWGIVLNAVMLAGVLFGLLLTILGIGFGLAFLPFAFF